MEFTKDLEGKIVLAIPTGNNARWKSSNEPIEMEVVKVKRKYVEMRRADGGLSENYCPKTGATQQAINSGYGNNAGYRFFENRKEYQAWEYRTTLISNVAKMVRDFNFANRLADLNDNDLGQLEKILLKVCDN